MVDLFCFPLFSTSSFYSMGWFLSMLRVLSGLASTCIILNELPWRLLCGYRCGACEGWVWDVSFYPCYSGCNSFYVEYLWGLAGLHLDKNWGGKPKCCHCRGEHDLRSFPKLVSFASASNVSFAHVVNDSTPKRSLDNYLKNSSKISKIHIWHRPRQTIRELYTLFFSFLFSSLARLVLLSFSGFFTP